MENKNVNIAQNLLELKVCTSRPPSAPVSREKILSDYARQLSSTAGKNSKQFPLNYQQNRVIRNNKQKTNPRRTQSAITNISSEKSGNTHHKSPIGMTINNHTRPYSASAIDGIGPPVFDFSSDKLNSDMASDASGSDSLSSPTKLIFKDNIHLIQEKTNNTKSGAYEIPMPNTLQTLKPWLTPNLPLDWTGIGGNNCYIFLPSLLRLVKDSLPIVPPVVLDPHEVLEYTSVIAPDLPWAPKRYEHPSWNRKRETDEWKCNHAARNNLRIYTTDGKLLHESHKGVRTVDIVRKEIKELEDLMRGIGTPGGSSLVVQYQAEINELQHMINKTLKRVNEIEKRDRQREEASRGPDTFGLRAFYSRHDEVMEQIRRQHAHCVRELAQLEEDLQLRDEHFRRRRQEDEQQKSTM